MTTPTYPVAVCLDLVAPDIISDCQACGAKDVPGLLIHVRLEYDVELRWDNYHEIVRVCRACILRRLGIKYTAKPGEEFKYLEQDEPDVFRHHERSRK